VGRLSQLDSGRVLKAFVRLGWAVDRVNGSHQILKAAGRATLTVPVHKGRPLKEGLMRALLKAAGVDEDAFFAAYR
jgi:predicted RNA binding protein YcfA (HicA-like mRNA interferase family)